MKSRCVRADTRRGRTDVAQGARRELLLALVGHGAHDELRVRVAAVLRQRAAHHRAVPGVAPWCALRGSRQRLMRTLAALSVLTSCCKTHQSPQIHSNHDGRRDLRWRRSCALSHVRRLAIRLVRQWRRLCLILQSQGSLWRSVGNYTNWMSASSVRSERGRGTYSVANHAMPTSVPVGQPLIRCQRPAPSLPFWPRHWEKSESLSLSVTESEHATFHGTDGSAVLGHLRGKGST